ncbi:MAG: cation:proton antiporter [Acidimicrobiia bacterium]
MNHNQFYIFAAITSAAVLLGLFAHRFKQPVLVAFVIVGIVVGPVGTGWVDEGSAIEFFSKLGIAVLLFLVGLKLDTGIIKKLGPVAFVIGCAQILVTFALGFALCAALGFTAIHSLYVSLALCFSSTIIIIKLLSDKRELESLHGKIAVGILIIQDLVVILTIIVLTAIGKENSEGIAQQSYTILLKGTLLILGLYLVTRFVLKTLVNSAAHSRELLVLFALAWALSIASLSDWLGFSTEIGAFLAGVSLASTKYRESIGARLVNLRNFFLLFFFIELGARLQFNNMSEQLVKAAIISLFVVVAKPLFTLMIMGLMGYSSKVSFRTGVSIAQISEFSLILATMGLALGHLDKDTFSLIMLIGIITISISTYFIQFSNQLYKVFEPKLKRFERKALIKSKDFTSEEFDVIIYGYGRLGSEITQEFLNRNMKVLVVDFDPAIAKKITSRNLHISFGDAEDLDLVQNLPLHSTRWIICTISDPNTNIALASELKALKYKGHLVLSARNRYDAKRVKKAESSLVVQPYDIAAKKAAEEILALE